MAASLPFIIVGLSFLPGASAIYAMMVAAHGLVYCGFGAAVIADRLDRRPFYWMRLVLVLFLSFWYFAVGPVLMSAAAAAMPTRR